MQNTLSIAIVALSALLGSHAAAQVLPDLGARPIRLIVPVAAGGGTDIVARIVTSAVADSAGLRMVVDNRSGAGGSIGSELVARSTPDGHTLLFAYASHTTAPFMLKVAYDAYADFTPITQVASSPLVLLVSGAVPANSVAELVALAKAKPKLLNAGIATSGSAGHLAVEVFKLRTGTTGGITSVIYKGGGQTQVALMSNEVQLVFASVISATAYMKSSGKVRALATSAKTRLSAFPDLPTFAELGIAVDTNPWQGILGPAKVPRSLVMRLYRDVAATLKQPDVVERLAAAGADPVGSTPEEFASKIKSELQEFGKIIRGLGLTGS